MKKLLVTLLVTMMSMSLLVGCGGSDNTNNDNDTTVNQEAEENQDISDEADNVEADVPTGNNLYDYTAPTALGDDITSLTFELEGVYYQFPMPVSELLANGWEIPSVYADVVVAPDSEEEIALENEEGKILYEVRVINRTANELPAADCMVSHMLVVSEEEFQFALPEGISFASTEDELKAVTEQGSIIQNGNYTTCTWDNEEWTDSISGWYHPEVGVEYFEFMSWE